MSNTHDADIFDTSDIVDEFETVKDKAHCYAYLTTDVYKAVCRFCYDSKIPTPKNVHLLKEKKGEPVIFSDSLYSPKESSVSGKSLYEDMVEYFRFYEPKKLYGFVDCRLQKNSAEKLTTFYNNISSLSDINVFDTCEGFFIKEQNTRYY